jgi:tellurite methyltransferase
MNFDHSYRTSKNYFGADPEETLRAHASSLPAESSVLDVGCGQGRNTFFLAERGIAVDALDPSVEAITQVTAVSAQRGWPVRGIQGTLEELPDPEELYGGVLLFGLFPLFTPAEIRAATGKALALLRPGGLVWSTAFTISDPRFEWWRSEAVETEGNSFRVKSGGLRTFLEAGEIVTIFEEASAGAMEVLHHREFLGPEHRHGDGPLERHGMAELVIRVG